MALLVRLGAPLDASAGSIFHAESSFPKENLTQHNWAGAVAPLDASALKIVNLDSI